MPFVPSVGPVDVGLQIVLPQVAVDRKVGRSPANVRGIDVLDATAGRKIPWRDVRPCLATVTGHVNGTVVGADPDHATLERRLVHRVDARIDLFAGDVASDRASRHHLIGLLVRGQVRADDLPGHAIVGRSVKDV